MKEITCAFETEVERAVTSGNWDERIGSHIASCSICRESVIVRDYVQALAKESAIVPDLPDAAYILWKAGLIQKQEAGKKIMRSIIFTRILAYTVFTCGLAGCFFYRWQQTREELDRFSRWLFVQTDTNFASGIQPLIVLAIVLLALNIALTLRAVRHEGSLKKSKRD
ncbi:MAG: hypothetical protein WBV94_05855 [Blastocatellia bacterium]